MRCLGQVLLWTGLDAAANDGAPGESSLSPLPNSGESGFSGGTCDALSVAREARSPLVGFLLASWIGLRTLSFFSSPDKKDYQEFITAVRSGRPEAREGV